MTSWSPKRMQSPETRTLAIGSYPFTAPAVMPRTNQRPDTK